MDKKITLLLLSVLSVGVFAQERSFDKSYVHFQESRGDSDGSLIITLPYEETVVLTNALNSTSGFGPTFNYYGTIVVVDQMDTMPNGDVQLILRREDGRDFYGYRPTLKAVLSKSAMASLEFN